MIFIMIQMLYTSDEKFSSDWVNLFNSAKNVDVTMQKFMFCSHNTFVATGCSNCNTTM